MDSKVAYQFVWDILQKERSSNMLQILPKEFYADIKEEIKNIKSQKITEEQELALQNIQKITQEIFEKRKQKILLYVAYKKQLPSPAIKEEQELYNKIAEVYANAKLWLDSSQRQEPQKETLRVIIDQLPEVFLPSGRKIGPLQKGQFVEAENDIDKEFLISNGLCINQQ